MIHEMKSWKGMFQSIVDGDKRFDLRQTDRKFHVGDNVLLREWNPQTQSYTGRSMRRVISFITDKMDNPCPLSSEGLSNDYCILGYQELEEFYQNHE